MVSVEKPSHIEQPSQSLEVEEEVATATGRGFLQTTVENQSKEEKTRLGSRVSHNDGNCSTPGFRRWSLGEENHQIQDTWRDLDRGCYMRWILGSAFLCHLSCLTSVDSYPMIQWWWSFRVLPPNCFLAPIIRLGKEYLTVMGTVLLQDSEGGRLERTSSRFRLAFWSSAI